ncbi:MAG: homocitrate synthase/isopropylmalate synthase family protein [Promethearchaeota archaeon]
MKYKFTNDEVKKLLYDYNSMAGVKPEDYPKEVSIWDETLRDGEQSPGVYLTRDEKIIIAKKMDEVGIDLIAVGFPAVSERELATVKAIVNEGLEHSKVLAISRPKYSDVNACLRADLDEIVLFMPISPLMMKVLKTTPEEEIDLIGKMITYARDHGLGVNWVSEDASRSRPEHLISVFKTAIEHGAKRIIISDTVGILNPDSINYIVNLVKREVIAPSNKDVGLGVHMHNDFGLAVANTVSAVFRGARFPHTCVNGYGERAGNAALEEVVMTLEYNGIKTNIKLDKLMELSKLVEELFCLPLAAHKPIVGDFSFSHESGLHVNAILAHPLTYEPINPKILGRNRKFYLGKFSGSGAIINALAEKLKLIDIEFPRDILQRIVNMVKEKQEKTPKSELKEVFRSIKENMAKLTSGVSDKDFYEIVRKVAGKELKKYLNKNTGLLDGIPEQDLNNSDKSDEENEK